ncbi:MAG: alanine racemase [Acidobacteriota bacterium]
MRPTWAEIRLDHIAANYRSIKTLVGEKVEVMAVVKADAYGHGALPIATHLEKEGVDWFGVALVEEGIALRRAGIKSAILCLGGFWQEEQAHDCIEYNLIPTIYRIDMLDTLNAVARACNQQVKFHVKLDTGMGRLGLSPEQLEEFLRHTTACQQLLLDGVMTHLAAAEEIEKNDFTNAQISRYLDCLRLIRKAGFNPHYEHIANSAGTHGWPQARGNLVRTGGLLYGFWRDVISPISPPPTLAPVLSLHTQIILLKSVPAGTLLGYGGSFRTTRESRIATLPIGYYDGLRRAYSNNGRVLVRGQSAPIVGRISMDLTLIDVTDITGVCLSDKVVLIGQSDNLMITAEEMASWIGTISYEVTCALSQRVPRFYLNSPKL